MKPRMVGIMTTYRGLDKSIYFLFAARIVNSLGSFVIPFLTIFLTDRLGLNEDQAGFYVMLVATSVAPGSLVGGKLVDTVGRKKILLVFQSLSALFIIPCAFLGNSMLIPWLLIAANFLNGAAVPAYSAIVNDLTDGENRKDAFSLQYLGVNIGFAVGPLIAGFLYRNHTQWIFIGDAATTFLALTLVLLFVEETIPSREQIRESFKLTSDERAEEGGVLRALLKRPILLVFAFVSMIYTLIYSQASFSLPLQLEKIFGPEGPKMYGSLMTVNSLVVVLLTTVIVGITRKIMPVLNVFLAGLFYAVGFGMLYFADRYLLYVLSTFIWSVGEVLLVTNTGIYIANHAPITHRGRFNAIIPVITGTGFALGPFITGKFIVHADVKMVWLVVFFLALAASLAMYLLYLVEKRQFVGRMVGEVDQIPVDIKINR